MKCRARRTDGKPCRADATIGSRYCGFHNPDPAVREARMEGRRKGGRNSRARDARPAPAALPPDTPDLPLRTVADIVKAVEETYNLVRTGRLDCRVGNCLGVLAQVQLRCLEGDALERRIEALEARQAARPVNGRPYAALGAAMR